MSQASGQTSVASSEKGKMWMGEKLLDQLKRATQCMTRTASLAHVMKCLEDDPKFSFPLLLWVCRHTLCAPWGVRRGTPGGSAITYGDVLIVSGCTPRVHLRRFWGQSRYVESRDYPLGIPRCVVGGTPGYPGRECHNIWRCIDCPGVHSQSAPEAILGAVSTCRKSRLPPRDT